MDEKEWFPECRDLLTKEILVKGEKFIYRYETGGDQNDWLDHFMVPVFDEEGNVKEYRRSLAKQNECLLMNVESVPFTKDLIGKLLKTEPKEWKQLSKENRVSVLRKIDPAIFSELIKMIRAAEDKEKDKKKS